ncbi:ATP-binding protein [Streptomyces sp. NPDC016566]|uniref:ATP-binding protein n=1 Tax=Streptomyces sp. NPDC016566 TaxID=3364967 RepID=UPI0036F4E42A
MDEKFRVTPCRPGEPPRLEDASRVGIMRRITAARLRYCGLEAMTGDVMVIVSELLTNAIQHSGTAEISLKVTLPEPGKLRISVRDGVEATVTPEAAADTSESGRGLALVDGLVEENGGIWGVSEDGSFVWCLLLVGGAS